MSRLKPLAGALVVLSVVAVMPAAVASHDGDTGRVDTRWVRHGFSQGWAVDAADLDGDGDDEVIYGGRKVAALDRASLAGDSPLWEVIWDHVDNDILDGGDNTWVTGLEMLDITGDGVEDALLTTSDTDAYLIDGATGAKVWHNPSTGWALSNGFALIDADDDGISDFYPGGGRTVYSGATGGPLWESPVPKPARFVETAELDGEPGRDALVSIHAQGAGTNPNTYVGALTSPTVFAVSSKGELLYQYSPVSGVESITAADVTGDGIDEAIVGTFNGLVYAVGELGPLWTSVPLPGPIQELASSDIDGDGFDEVLAGGGAITGDDPTFSVVALDNTGAQLWREPTGGRVSVLEMAQLDDDEAEELLVGGGATSSGSGASYAMALEVGLAQPLRVKWQLDTYREVKSAAVAVQGGRRLVVLGSDDTLLRAVDAATGEAAWTYAAGSYILAVAAGDLDGDGHDEAVRVDDKATIIATTSTGGLLWSARSAVGGAGALLSVATGDANGDGDLEVAVTGWRYGTGGGVVELYDGDGSLLWSRTDTGSGEKVLFADLDGDGRDEVVTAESSGIDANCTVAALDESTGEDLWRVPVASCLIPTIATGDVDGDGLPEIAYGDRTLVTQPHAALLEHDGSVTWNVGVTDQVFWLETRPGSILYAGYGSSSRGSVHERSASDGSVRWSNLVADDEDMGSAFRFATATPDVTGDGRPEIATTSDDGTVRLMDGAGAGELWTTRIESSEPEVMQRHQSGPIVFIPAQQGNEPMLLVNQGGIHRKRAGVFALTLDGQIVGSSATEGEGHGAAPMVLGDGVIGGLFGAGLGMYAFDVCAGCSVETQIPTVLSLTFERVRGDVVVVVSLIDADTGAGIKAVTLTIEGLAPYTLVTDVTGTATLAIHRNEAKKDTPVTATFGGDARYLPSEATGTLP